MHNKIQSYSSYDSFAVVLNLFVFLLAPLLSFFSFLATTTTEDGSRGHGLRC